MDTGNFCLDDVVKYERVAKMSENYNIRKYEKGKYIVIIK